MIRFLLPCLIFILLTPSWAHAVLDFSKFQRQVFDSNCTDSFDVPATTSGRDLTDYASYDTPGEAVDPSVNYDDAVQTSGSADGWCDAEPWVIATNTPTVAGASEQLWIGPVNYDPAGFYVAAAFPTAQTSWSVVVMYYPVIFNGGSDSIGAILAETVMTTTLSYLGPYTESSGSISQDESFFKPQGVPLYLRVDLTGTGDWDVDMALIPVAPHQTRGR